MIYTTEMHTTCLFTPCIRWTRQPFDPLLPIQYTWAYVCGHQGRRECLTGDRRRPWFPRRVWGYSNAEHRFNFRSVSWAVDSSASVVDLTSVFRHVDLVHVTAWLIDAASATDCHTGSCTPVSSHWRWHQNIMARLQQSGNEGQGLVATTESLVHKQSSNLIRILPIEVWI